MPKINRTLPNAVYHATSNATASDVPKHNLIVHERPHELLRASRVRAPNRLVSVCCRVAECVAVADSVVVGSAPLTNVGSIARRPCLVVQRAVLADGLRAIVQNVG